MDVKEKDSGGRTGRPLFPWGFLALLTVPLAVAGLVIWYVTAGAIFFGDIDWYRTCPRADPP